MFKYMLGTLMDGIKDANMMMDYAEDALALDNDKAANWFKSHAKIRLDLINSDLEYINREMGLIEKAKDGDAIADALMSHLDYQIEELTKKYNCI